MPRLGEFATRHQPHTPRLLQARLQLPNPAQVQCAGRVVCWGFLGAVTKCVYKAATVDVERYSWKMSAEMVEEEVERPGMYACVAPFATEDGMPM